MLTVNALTPAGVMTATYDGDVLIALRFAADDARPDDHPAAEQVTAAVSATLRGDPHELAVRLDVSEFASRVLHAAALVPAGATVSYAQLAAMAGCPGGSRAVGGALAANPLLVLFPCHRIIRADGSPGGFAAGVQRKRQLLALEADQRVLGSRVSGSTG